MLIKYIHKYLCAAMLLLFATTSLHANPSYVKKSFPLYSSLHEANAPKNGTDTDVTEAEVRTVLHSLPEGIIILDDMSAWIVINLDSFEPDEIFENLTCFQDTHSPAERITDGTDVMITDYVEEINVFECRKLSFYNEMEDILAFQLPNISFHTVKNMEFIDGDIWLLTEEGDEILLYEVLGEFDYYWNAYHDPDSYHDHEELEEWWNLAGLDKANSYEEGLEIYNAFIMDYFDSVLSPGDSVIHSTFTREYYIEDWFYTTGSDVLSRYDLLANVSLKKVINWNVMTQSY